MRFIATAILVLALGACATPLHKPTDVGNIATTGNVAYGVAGVTARQYLAMPLCAATPVYPCATQALKDRVFAADEIAYKAAVVAGSASATAIDKQTASDKAKALKAITDEPDIKTQTDLAAAKAAQH